MPYHANSQGIPHENVHDPHRLAGFLRRANAGGHCGGAGRRDPEWRKFQREWANAVIVGRKYGDFWENEINDKPGAARAERI